MQKILLVLFGIAAVVAGTYFIIKNSSLAANSATTGSGLDMAAFMHVSDDKTFLEAMIPHHQEAVDAAREVLTRGGEIPAIRALAQSIVVSQEREITMMKEWYEAWYGTPYQDTGTYVKMMKDLSPYTGSELDGIFTKDMIVHHQGAVMMAEMALDFTKRDEIRDMSKAIQEEQEKEIVLMEAVLSGASERAITVRVSSRTLGPSVVSVTEGDVITLSITTDESGEFHIAGYEIEHDMEPGATLEFPFLANQAGRYNIELHPAVSMDHEVGEGHDEESHEDIVIGALVVNPR